MPVPTWPIAAGSLLAGFGVAELTGVRPLGGLVLVGAAAWCAVRWQRRRGTPTTVALLVVYAGGFAASHALADTLGAWGAVARRGGGRRRCRVRAGRRAAA